MHTVEVGRNTYLNSLKEDRVKILKNMKFKPLSLEEQDDIICYLQAYEHFDLIEGFNLFVYIDYVIDKISREKHNLFCTLNTDTEKFIIEFIEKLKLRYSELIIGYEYNEEEDQYCIWHTNKYLQFSGTNEFLNYSGNLLKTVLYNNNIYNISFGYDYRKDKMEEYKNNVTATPESANAFLKRIGADDIDKGGI